ncbi:MAG: fructosamine kinase family protein [Gammaproteobacteria bacterium]|nr:fructosamine kinase family protein [Gammaproteobacteria bacterium]
MNWTPIVAHIAEITGRPFSPIASKPIAGGCINSAAVLSEGRRRYFVKFNHASRLGAFEAEVDGLKELRRSQTVRVPSPICCGAAGDRSYFVLEYVDLHATSSKALVALGQQLAEMHRTTSEQFGWWRDNTIGATVQRNTPTADWAEFWQVHRLGFQLELAAGNGYHGRLLDLGEKLLADLGILFQDYQPQPSLLHGDLWCGNYAEDAAGRPVIFDPAPYFGDREADLAMTELFGGFGPAFYEAYQNTWPLDAGYQMRRHLYNLYHVLNHLNLFGSGYLAQCETLIDRILQTAA